MEPAQSGIDREGRTMLVMTGGTSGLGRRVVETLMVSGQAPGIILIARRSQHALEMEQRYATRGVAFVWADLADLSSVASACREVLERLGGATVTHLVLNAAVQAVGPQQATKDGLEIAFAVNHLAHFLIAERLRSRLAAEGRVVITSSEVHDPHAYCAVGITRARWQDPVLLADPRRSQAHERGGVDLGEARYCASKLLNLQYVRHLAAGTPRCLAVAFNPGVMPGTEIARERNPLVQLGWHYALPGLSFLVPGLRSVERSAADMIWLMQDADPAVITGQYVDGRTVAPGSGDSRDFRKIERLVEVSHALLQERGLSIEGLRWP